MGKSDTDLAENESESVAETTTVVVINALDYDSEHS